jgi:hypothetical protein
MPHSASLRKDLTQVITVALNQPPSVIPLAYEFFMLFLRPQRAGTANAIVVA